MSETADTSQIFPVGSAGELSSGWWGMKTLIITEASLFVYLIFSYLYLASQTPQHWPPEGLPRIGIGAFNTSILFSSSVFVWLCERLVRRRKINRAIASMGLAILLGVVFVGIQLKEWHAHPYGIATHLYGSLYFTITGFHVIHVLVGLIVLTFLLLWIALGYFDEKRCAALKVGGLYWHFVDVVWIFIFITLYVTPFANAQAATPAAGTATAFSDPTLIARGAYLAKLADCSACHTSTTKGSAPFAGGLGMGSPLGTIYSSNITPDPKTGIGQYSYADFDRALREGVTPTGKRLYPAMPYPSFTKMSDADMRALYAYFMHGVQPVSAQPPETKLPFPFNQRWGLFVWDLAFVRHDRYMPNGVNSAQWNRGAYIVQSLGHCGACHTPRGIAYEERGYDESSRLYLTGGVNDNWFAPNLTGDPGSGLGRLSERDIVSFLKSGHGKQVHIVTFGSMTQVVEDSAQHFSEDDLKAVAIYLKSLPARGPSGAYEPDSLKARQADSALKTGDIQRPGSGLYMSSCVKCHKADGHGEFEKYPSLAGNPAVLAPDTTSMIRMVMQGGESPQTLTGPKPRKMPAFASKLTDTEIARVLTFVRTTWGNQASPVLTRDVAALRARLEK